LIKLLNMKLNEKQCKSLAKLSYDFARVVFVGIVVEQVVNREKFNIWVFILGIIWIILLVTFGIILEKNKKNGGEQK